MMTKKAGTCAQTVVISSHHGVCSAKQAACASPAALILDLGLQNVLVEVQKQPQSAIFASALLAES